MRAKEDVVVDPDEQWDAKELGDEGASGIMYAGNASQEKNRILNRRGSLRRPLRRALSRRSGRCRALLKKSLD